MKRLLKLWFRDKKNNTFYPETVTLTKIKEIKDKVIVTYVSPTTKKQVSHKITKVTWGLLKIVA